MQSLFPQRITTYLQVLKPVREHDGRIGVVLCLMLSSWVLLFSSAASAVKTVNKKNATWIELTAGKTYQLNGCEFTEKIDDTTLIRTDYIKRRTDKKPLLFYTHQRAVAVRLGHRERLVLINDREATKANKVMVVSLGANKAKRIDLTAIAMYQRNASPSDRLVIIPEAYAFSPDDREILIKMRLIYVAVGSKEEVDQEVKTYKGWWYAVDSHRGQVKQEYRTTRLPRRWWVDSRTQAH